MNTAANRIQLLFQETAYAYQSEREIAAILPAFLSRSTDDCLSDGISREIRQNRDRLARLEAVLASISQVTEKGVASEHILKQLSMIVRRIESKQARTNYETATYLALARGLPDLSVRLQRASRAMPPLSAAISTEVSLTHA